jgi:hypothetical protein
MVSVLKIFAQLDNINSMEIVTQIQSDVITIQHSIYVANAQLDIN